MNAVLWLRINPFDDRLRVTDLLKRGQHAEILSPRDESFGFEESLAILHHNSKSWQPQLTGPQNFGSITEHG